MRRFAGAGARPGLVPATRTSRARSRLRGGIPTSRVGVRSHSTRDSRASNPGVPLDSGVFPGLALPRARLPFSARPQPAPGAHPISRALVGSARGVDPIHRDRLEGGPVDAAFVEDRLHPLRGPSKAAPGLLGVLRVAVLRGPFAAGEPRIPPLRREIKGVYPRTGGGTREVASGSMMTSGLSPHGRGNRFEADHRIDRRRSIPARAGEPAGEYPRSASGKVYPRTGGGTSTKQQTDNAQLLRNKCRVCVLTGS